MVKHLVEQQRFVIEKDGFESVLDYELDGNSIDFTHTYVPTELRGQGLAEKIVRAGIAWAKEQGYELHASCSYAAKFIR